MTEDQWYSVDLAIHDPDNEDIDPITLGWFKHRKAAEEFAQKIKDAAPYLHTGEMSR